MKKQLLIIAALMAAGMAHGQMFAQMFAATSTARLPVEYQEVEYLEASGTQYIDSGVYASNTTKMIVDASFANDGWLFGEFVAGASFGIGSVSGKIYPKWGTVSGVSSGVDMSASRFVYMIDSGAVSRGGTTVYTFAAQTFTSSVTIGIFADKRASSWAAADLDAKVYSAKIWTAGTAVRDYVPAVRKADSVAGMYDLVNGTFTVNSGTGTFTAGPNVD